ncbi:MAG: flagellar biosynthesis protein FlhF [Polyangiaceae bacterium]|nr:flagellar biosynthesis protein FlhF [Polyangiaceae bacterium]
MDYQTFRGPDLRSARGAVRAALGPDVIIGSTREIPLDDGTARRAVEVRAALAPPSPHRSGVRPRPQPVSQVEHLEREIDRLRAEVRALAARRRTRDRATAALLASGVGERLAADLAVGSPKRASDEGVARWLRRELGARISLDAGVAERSGPRVVAAVGPTGAGKTTTLAKLAARARLDQGRRVTVVSFDAYRVGAVEQWRRYAHLLGLQLETSRDELAVARALAQPGADLVLVDTAGGAPGDETFATAARALGRVVDSPLHTLLVLPAFLGAEEAEHARAQYARLGADGLVVTKLDEALSAGGVLGLALAGLRVAYLCDGPRVPEDVAPASLERVLDALLAQGERA